MKPFVATFTKQVDSRVLQPFPQYTEIKSPSPSNNVMFNSSIQVLNLCRMTL